LDKNTIFLLVLFSPGSAETDIGCGGKLNSHWRPATSEIFLSKCSKIC